MPKKVVRFTQADVARALRAAKQCGAHQVLILPDGTIEIKLQSEAVSTDSRNWDDLSAPGQKRKFGSRLGQQSDHSDPLSLPFARFERGEISIEQLPAGKYPNGMRVYADGEREAIVRSRPLGKLERSCLKAYFHADGNLGYRGGIATNEKLEARGYIEVVGSRPKDRMPNYNITQAGRDEWLRLSKSADEIIP